MSSSAHTPSRAAGHHEADYRHLGDRGSSDHAQGAILLAIPGRHGRGSGKLAVLGQPDVHPGGRLRHHGPVNRALLARGRGHAVVHQYHH